jgi:hypothetical protein
LPESTNNKVRNTVNFKEYLNDNEMLEALGDIVYASGDSGALLTALDLSTALSCVYQACPTEMSILQLLAENAATANPDAIVVKAYADEKYGNLKMVGIKAGVLDGQFVVFGVPVPADVNTSIGTVEAGKVGETYKRTELKLTKSFKDADGDECPVSLSFELVMPSAVPSDGYHAWLESLLGKTKKALLSSDLIGAWKEPGQGNVSLLQLAETAIDNGGYARYQVVGWGSKSRLKKNPKNDADTWTSYSLHLIAEDGSELETDSWIVPQYFGFSDMMRRTISKGKQPFYLHLHGTIQQCDKNGDLQYDNEGNPRMEAIGKINTIENFPPNRRQATIAATVPPKQMRSASDDFDIVDAQSGSLALAGDW